MFQGVWGTGPCTPTKNFTEDMMGRTFSRVFAYGGPYDMGRVFQDFSGPTRVKGVPVLVTHRVDDFVVVTRSHADYLKAIS